MPQYPKTYPATIINNRENIEGYDNYLKQIKENVEIKRQRADLKAAKVAEGFIPPDIDLNGVFPGDEPEIMNMMSQYQQKAMEYADQGKDWLTDPQGSKERLKLEGEILKRVNLSKRDKALYDDSVTRMGTKGFDDEYLRDETMTRLAGFKDAGAKKGILGRDEYLGQNGSLLHPKGWDINEFMENYTKDIEPEFLVDESVEKSSVPGYRKQTRKYWLSPEELNGRTQVMLNDRNFRKALEDEWANLTPAAQALLDNEAVAKGYADPMQVLAERELEKWVIPKQEIKDLSIPGYGSGGSKTTVKKVEDSETLWLVNKFAAARAGDVNTMDEQNINGKQFYSIDIPHFQFDFYTDYVPAVIDEKTGTELEPAKQLQVPEYIEELLYDPATKKWYAYTNKTVSKKISKGFPPKPYGYEMTDQLWSKLLRGIVLNNAGTNKFSQSELEEILKSMGAQTSTGDINWNAIAGAKSGVNWGGGSGGTGSGTGTGGSGITWK